MDRVFVPGDQGAGDASGNPVTDSAPNSPMPSFQAQAAPGESRYFTVEDIERARREEKEKLYGRIEKQNETLKTLQERLAQLEAEREEARRREEEQRKAQEEAEKRKREEEMTVRQLLQEKEAEWEQRFRELEAAREAERAALEQERRFSALREYIQRRIREVQADGSVAPELIEFIDGNSEEEVDQRIEHLKAKTEELARSFQRTIEQAGANVPPRGVSPAGYAAAGPMEANTEQRMPTPQEIRQMSMAEYAEFRKKIGLGDPPHGRGLFG